MRGTGFASRGCVVCGRENPAGLRAVFVTGPEGAVARTAVPEQLQGFEGLAHGGVVAGLLDDAMWYACYGAGAVTLTAELVTRFRRPVGVGQAVVARGWVVEVRGRFHAARAELRDAAGGELLAEARGKFLAVEEPLRGRLVGGGVQEVEVPAGGERGGGVQEIEVPGGAEAGGGGVPEAAEGTNPIASGIQERPAVILGGGGARIPAPRGGGAAAGGDALARQAR